MKEEKKIHTKSIFMLFLLIDEGARTCAEKHTQKHTTHAHVHTESKEIESKIL